MILRPLFCFEDTKNTGLLIFNSLKQKKLIFNFFVNRNWKKLTDSRKRAKVLADNRKSHHPIETLLEGNRFFCWLGHQSFRQVYLTCTLLSFLRERPKVNGDFQWSHTSLEKMTLKGWFFRLSTLGNHLIIPLKKRIQSQLTPSYVKLWCSLAFKEIIQLSPDQNDQDIGSTHK